MSSPKVSQPLQVTDEPLDYDSTSAFAKWLRSVPHIANDDTVTIAVNVTLCKTHWFWLAEGMSHNKATLDKMISFLLEDSDVITELCNGGHDMTESDDSMLSRLRVGTGTSALAELWPDVVKGAEKSHLSLNAFVKDALMMAINRANQKQEDAS